MLTLKRNTNAKMEHPSQDRSCTCDSKQQARTRLWARGGQSNIPGETAVVEKLPSLKNNDVSLRQFTNDSNIRES